MQVLLAVVEDLYTFAVSMLFPWRTDQKDMDTQLYLPPSRVVSPYRDVVELDAYRKVSYAVHEAIVRGTSIKDSTLPQKNTIAYCARAQVPLRTTRDSATDTAIATLAYGDMVMVLEASREYASVAVGDKKGYVPTSALVQKAADVHPAFVVGSENSALETNTIRVRLIIRDEFSASLTQLPLQAHEYVYYKLLRRGTHIEWPDIRPRTPGSWTKILSTLVGVTIADAPTPGSIMEFSLVEGKAEGEPEGKAHLAYVEKVSSDQSIRISEADWPDRGIYNERTLALSEWQILKPTFITIG